MSIFSTTNVGAKVDIKERGILMSAPMVRAAMRTAKPKTQTRRAMKIQPYTHLPHGADVERWHWRPKTGVKIVLDENGVKSEALLDRCPYGRAGDRLWVREGYSGPHWTIGSPPRDWAKDTPIWYWADGNPAHGDWTKPKPGMHLPRWASRTTLEITAIRVEPLQDISEADAMAEGITCENVIVSSNCNGGTLQEETADRYYFDGCPDEGFDTGIEAYAALWDHINGADSWDANPWVWVVEFKRLTT